MYWEKIDSAQLVTDPGLFGATSGIKVLMSRAEVPGGWLVLAATTIGDGYPVSITFYPDPTHAWEVRESRKD